MSSVHFVWGGGSVSETDGVRSPGTLFTPLGWVRSPAHLRPSWGNAAGIMILCVFLCALAFPAGGVMCGEGLGGTDEFHLGSLRPRDSSPTWTCLGDGWVSSTAVRWEGVHFGERLGSG